MLRTSPSSVSTFGFVRVASEREQREKTSGHESTSGDQWEKRRGAPPRSIEVCTRMPINLRSSYSTSSGIALALDPIDWNGPSGLDRTTPNVAILIVFTEFGWSVSPV